MGSPGDTAAEKRARWRSYFAQQLTGGDAEIDAATEAAMRALERGADVNEIVAAGIEGARVFRSYRVPDPELKPRPRRSATVKSETGQPSGPAPGMGLAAHRALLRLVSPPPPPPPDQLPAVLSAAFSSVRRRSAGPTSLFGTSAWNAGTPPAIP